MYYRYSEVDDENTNALDIQRLLKITDYVVEKLGSKDDKELAKRLVSGKLSLHMSEYMVLFIHVYTVCIHECMYLYSRLRSITLSLRM